MAFTQVQKVAYANQTAASFTLPFGSVNTVGNLLIAIVSSFSGGIQASPVPISDSQGNTWLQAGSIASNSVMYYVPACKGGANTITFANIAARVFVALAEYSGQAISGVVLDETYQPSTVSGTTATAYSYIQNPNSLLIAMFQSTASTETWSALSAGWTGQSTAAGQFVFWADNKTPSAGANTVSVTVNTADTLHARIACFVPAGLAQPSTPQFVRTCESPIKNLLPPGAGVVTNTFFGGNQNGNTILVFCNEFAKTTTSTITGITDTAGNTYTTLDTEQWPTLNEFTTVFKASPCKGTSLANVITVSFSAESDSIDIFAIEIAGQVALDSTAQQLQLVTSSVSYPIVCAAANEFIYTFGIRNSGTTVSGFGSQIDLATPLGGANIHAGESVVAYLPPTSATLGSNTITQTWGGTQGASKSFAFTAAPSGPTTTGLKGQPVPIALCDLNGNVYAVAGTSKGLQVGGAIPVVITDPSGNVYTLTGTPTGVKMGNPTPIVLTDFNGNALAVNGSLSAFKAGRPYPVILCDQNGNAFSTSSYTGGTQQGAPLSAVLTDSNGNVQLSASLLATIVGMI